MPNPFLLPNMWTRKNARFGARRTLKEVVNCEYCGREFTRLGLGSHAKSCSKKEGLGPRVSKVQPCGVGGCTKPLGLCWEHEVKSDVFADLDSRIEKETKLRAQRDSRPGA